MELSSPKIKKTEMEHSSPKIRKMSYICSKLFSYISGNGTF